MKRILSVLLSLCLMASLAVPAMAVPAQTSGAASTLRLESTEGTVQMKDAAGKIVKATKGVRLYNGYNISTQKSSYAFVSLDNSKAVKLDASTNATVFQSGKKLELTASSGQLFFNVTEPLKSDESLKIRTSTMVTGVRGTCGWIEITDRNTTRLSLLEGSLTVTSPDPVTGEKRTVTIQGGQTLTVVYEGDGHGFDPSLIGDNITIQDLIDQGIIDENNIILTGVGLTIEELQEEKVPGFVAVEVTKNPDLQKKIEETTNLSVPDIIKDAEKRLAEEEAAAEQQDQQIQSELENLSADETDPLFESSAETTGGSGGGGGGGGGNAAPARGVVTSTSDTTSALNLELEEAAAAGNDVVVSNTVSAGNDQTPVVVQPGQTMTLANGATLDGGTYDVQGTLAVDAGATVTNNALINVDSTNSLEISGTLINSGTINVGASADGALRILSGGHLINEDGMIYVGPSDSANVSGLLEIQRGGTLSADVVIAQTGTLTNAGNLNAPVENSGVMNNTGIINGPITNYGTMTNNGSISGSIMNHGMFTNNHIINGAVNQESGTTNHYGSITSSTDAFQCHSGTLNISGATVAATDYRPAINLQGSITLTIENSTITAADTAIGCSEGGISYSAISIDISNSQIQGSECGIDLFGPFDPDSSALSEKQENRQTLRISSDSTVSGGSYGVYYESYATDLIIAGADPSATSPVSWYDISTKTSGGSGPIPITYTVTCWVYTDSDGNGTGIPASQTVTAGIPTTFSISYSDRLGYTLDGWFTADGTKYLEGQILNLTSDLELFARWSPNTYTVALNANNGSSEPVPEPPMFTFTFDELQSLPENPFTYEGYTFIGWAFYATPQYYDTIYNVQNGNNTTKDIQALCAAYITNDTLYARWEATT